MIGKRPLPGIIRLALLVFTVFPSVLSGQAVQAREEILVIPTYPVGPPEQNPVFYSGRAYQGAQGPIYPYPLLDKLSVVARDQSYRILYLENEYIRIGILPEIGGRIFEAIDKTNGYDFVYRQHVIKPALIGMTGAWISGGVEWNIPHHHRATSFTAVDSLIERGDDGSATVWVGEIERRHRTKWTVGVTLRPGSSVMEVSTRIINRTALPQSILCFANVAVHANEGYQVLFPPSTEIATFHGKNQFSRWPVSREVFNNQDYRAGVDVSWWKNHLTPTSFFAFDLEEDFFGGYDHGKKAGIALIGDHHVVPGRKLWTWGTGSEGKTWEKILTDADGPYLELMIGSYSDNQPDYSWMAPYETKAVEQFWYPIRGLGGLKNATREAACNMILSSDRTTVGIAFNATSPRKGVRGVLQNEGKVVFEETFDIAPDSPFEREVTLRDTARKADLELVLYSREGLPLVRYAEPPRRDKAFPKPVVPPPPPEEIATVEELYLAGQRLEQFHSAALEPYPYYEDALRRDPSNVRVNTALAILGLKRGLWKEAEEKLEIALARLTFNHTRPRDGEAYYFLGVALRAQARIREAEEAFKRAAWSASWRAASAFHLAEIASASGRISEARNWLVQSLASNALNIRALGLEATLLRKLEHGEEALRVATAALRIDPLDLRAARESEILRPRDGEPATREAIDTIPSSGDAAANALELALEYGDAGFWDEALGVLEETETSEHPASPLLVYARAYGLDRLGRSHEARSVLETAAELPPDLVFPFQLEFTDILEWGMKENPRDSRAPYYLGNLLFDHQPARAMRAWEKSRELDGSFSIVHRNLGLAYAGVLGNLDDAVGSLEKAVAANGRDSRHLFELDVLREASGTPPEARLKFLQERQDVVIRSDNTMIREIGLLIQTGRSDVAIRLLQDHHFHVWEGGGEIHGLWVDAHLQRGRSSLEKKDYRDALKAFEAAGTYPENLEVGPPSRGAGSAKILYFIGLAHEHLGNPVGGAAYFAKSAESGRSWSEQSYYRGLSLRKLGREDEATTTFTGLLEFALGRLENAPAMNFFEKFGERQSARKREALFHFLAGLGLQGINKPSEAAAEFEKALVLDPNLSEVRHQLEKTGISGARKKGRGPGRRGL